MKFRRMVHYLVGIRLIIDKLLFNYLLVRRIWIPLNFCLGGQINRNEVDFWEEMFNCTVYANEKECKVKVLILNSVKMRHNFDNFFYSVFNLFCSSLLTSKQFKYDKKPNNSIFLLSNIFFQSLWHSIPTFTLVQNSIESGSIDKRIHIYTSSIWRYSIWNEMGINNNTTKRIQFFFSSSCTMFNSFHWISVFIHFQGNREKDCQQQQQNINFNFLPVQFEWICFGRISRIAHCTALNSLKMQTNGNEEGW